MTCFHELVRSDEEFDTFLPPPLRRVSSVYWTTVSVARAAARAFARLGVRRVLDVGSGPGKFCLVAAAKCPWIEFVGVEHRRHLVDVARSIARSSGLSNVTFEHGDATRLDWRPFDGFYIYNSFAENAFGPGDQLDQTVDLSRARQIADVRRVAERLGEAAQGNILVTYHGLGGPIPSSYVFVGAKSVGEGWIRAWRQGPELAPDRVWVEDGPEITAWSRAAPPSE